MKAISSFLLIVSLLIPIAEAHAGFFSFVTSVFASDIGTPDTSTLEPTQNSQTLALLQPAAAPNPKEAASAEDITISNSALVAETGPSGLSSDGTSDDESSPSDQVSIYVVRKGDTVAQIAEMFNVSANTILYANDLKKGQALTEGSTLIILPVTGIQYTVKKGDTLSSIAKKFKLDDSSDIESFNGITDESMLSIGQTLIIPGVELSAQPVVSKSSSGTHTSIPSLPQSSGGSATGYYIKPIPCPLSQGKHDHYAVDLSCHTSGIPIKAAADGTVILSKYGYNGGFGNLVVISHPNGTQTFYAHQSSILAKQGQQVSQGEIIGYVGSTGRSTGPHLHFEVRGATNPGFDRTGNSWKKE